MSVLVFAAGCFGAYFSPKKKPTDPVLDFLVYYNNHYAHPGERSHLHHPRVHIKFIYAMVR